MKKRIIPLILAVLLVCSSMSAYPASALSNEAVDLVYSEEYYSDLVTEIQSLIAEVDALDETEWSAYMADNSERIKEVDQKFSDYVAYHMENFAVEHSYNSKLIAANSDAYAIEQARLLSNMVGRNLAVPTTGQTINSSGGAARDGTGNGYDYYAQFYFDYFDSPATYGLRGEYMSYGMLPKTDVRLFAAMAEAAWPCVMGLWSYSMTTNLTGLYDQYMCHHYGSKIQYEEEWNIEPARPDVGLVATMAAKCNPV